MSDVLFKDCTSSEYSSITPDSNIFYKVQDSDSEAIDVYLGKTKLSISHDISVDKDTLCIIKVGSFAAPLQFI